MRERYYMQRAIQLALKGKGRTSVNPMVGAVLVRNNKIISEGWHQRFGGPHAEVLALKKSWPIFKGCGFVYHLGTLLSFR